MSSSLARKRAQARQEKRAQRNKQILRFTAFTTIVAVVIIAVVYFLAPVFASKESGITQDANAKIVNVQAAMDGFDLQEIRVKVGETVKVNLRSLDNEHHTDGGGKHQFAIDELKVNLVAQPLSVNSATFTPTQPGTFTYYCDICCGGKANPTMNGKLIVEG
ncbi:MAG: cupredoxin domain-containing protein [Chloroflexi bacterium]|nr:cupredoxin domain-containing protein [Chloroflexota bacterium]